MSEQVRISVGSYFATVGPREVYREAPREADGAVRFQQTTVDIFVLSNGRESVECPMDVAAPLFDALRGLYEARKAAP